MSESAYEIGDEVYPIHIHGENKQIQCSFCEGIEFFEVERNGIKRNVTCPECYGRGYEWKEFKKQWHVDVENISKIGQIETVETKDLKEVTYMIEATGIGGGVIWKEEDIFRVRTNASAECEARNKMLDRE